MVTKYVKNTPAAKPSKPKSNKKLSDADALIAHFSKPIKWALTDKDIQKLLSKPPEVTGKKQAKGSKVLAAKPKRKGKASAAPAVKKPPKKPTPKKPKYVPVKSIPENEFTEDLRPTPHVGPLKKELLGRFLDKKFPGQEMTVTESGDKEFPYRLTNTSPAMKQAVHIDDLTEKQVAKWLQDMKPAKK